MKKRHKRRRPYHFPMTRTSPEGFGLRSAAHYASRGWGEPVIGPSGQPLYGAAAVTFLHHRGHKGRAAYPIIRYHPGESEWRRRMLSTKTLRSR